MDILEKNILELDGAEEGNNSFCPLTHRFTDGIYIREIYIPAGTIMTGRIHKHAHPNFLQIGKVKMITEAGKSQEIEGPSSMISSAGTKRVLFTLTPVIWTTIHHNPDNITDIDELEKMIAVNTYEEYDQFLLESEKPQSLMSRLVKSLRGIF